MKTLLDVLSKGLMILVFVYLVFSFFQGEYQVKEWPIEARFIAVGVCFFGTFIALLTTGER